LEDLKGQFGKRLKALRKQKHMTQEQLAEASDISVDFLSLIERGKNAPPFEIIALSLFKELGSIEAEGVIWAYRSLCAILSGETTIALAAARCARELADVRCYERDIIRAKWLLGWVLVRLAHTAGEQGTQFLQEAELHLVEALNRCRRIDMVDYEADLLLANARLHQAKGEKNQAKEYVTEALVIANRSDFRTLRADIYNLLARLELEDGNQKDAKTYTQLALQDAMCDSPPYCYKPALEEAKSLLENVPGQSRLNFATPQFERSQQAAKPEKVSTQTTILPLLARRIEIFFSYSHKDEAMRQELEIHLSNLKRQSIITGWHDGEIKAGDVWEEEISAHLNSANIILLLISPDFIHSNYCYEKEMMRAMERHKAEKARVVPIILRPTHWERSPFEKLQALPVGAKAITAWQNRDEAYVSVVKGIQKVVDEWTKNLP
jgi:transcriptional regulator with XRE-family HTH domain